MRRRHPIVLFIVVLGAAILIGVGKPVAAVLISALATYVLFTIGLTVLGGLARPVPEPPPAGELRKVKIMFRCAVCGTEVRMTIAPDEDPQAPRHCLEDMDLVAPTME